MLVCRIWGIFLHASMKVLERLRRKSLLGGVQGLQQFCASGKRKMLVYTKVTFQMSLLWDNVVHLASLLCTANSFLTGVSMADVHRLVSSSQLNCLFLDYHFFPACIFKVFLF